MDRDSEACTQIGIQCTDLAIVTRILYPIFGIRLLFRILLDQFIISEALLNIFNLVSVVDQRFDTIPVEFGVG